MVLKTQTDYGLRVLLYLGFHKKQVAVEEIAKAYAISKDHLVKVVQQLVRMGYVSSRAGRTGGIRLAKEAATINVAEVVAGFEGRNGVLQCVSDPTYCNIEPGCVLKHLLVNAEEAFYETLGRATIADLLKGNEMKQSGGLYNITLPEKTTSAPVAADEGNGKDSAN